MQEPHLGELSQSLLHTWKSVESMCIIIILKMQN